MGLHTVGRDLKWQLVTHEDGSFHHAYPVKMEKGKFCPICHDDFQPWFDVEFVAKLYPGIQAFIKRIAA